MARKGRFSASASNPSLGRATKVSDTVSGVQTSSDTSGAAERGRLTPLVKYGIFGAITFFLSIVVAGAVVAWLGTVLATLSNTDRNTSLLTMLDAWFFPMLTLSMLTSFLLFAALRRIWRALERRFG